MAICQSCRIFLLGGYDLEMLTIKQMLEGRDDCVFFDRHLNWGNATLSAYGDEIKNHPDSPVYGIELKEDIPCPKNYHSIDHHNSKEDNASSLEQVADILGIKLTRRQMLVAANDKGYIPAMMEMGATKEEIADIRLQDRKTQGISDADEHLAEESIEKFLATYGDLYVVKSLTSHFAPICDRLYPYHELLVYTDEEWVYYGKQKPYLVEKLQNEIQQGRIYHGGDDQGYIGTVKGAFTIKDINNFVEIMISQSIYSYHNFMFPFRWEKKNSEGKTLTEQIALKKKKNSEEKTLTEQIALKNVTFESSTQWERGTPDGITYDERNYFYEFVHKAIYDKDGDASHVRHYERKEPKTSSVTFEIATKEKVYKLQVKGIHLNMYSTGVGILSFHLYNHEYPSPDDVLRINQMGRRIFPPYIASKDGDRGMIAHSIEIKGLKGQSEYKEDFNGYKEETKHNTPASFIGSLIDEACKNILRKPVVDDRMFVLCWYKNDEWANELGGKDYDRFLHSSKWYEFVYVDDLGGMSCQNDAMQHDLITKATYNRWQKYKSLYGITRYSMVYLTNTNCFTPTLNTFETMYAKMAEHILVQKATVLRFSSEVTNIISNSGGKIVGRKVDSLYREYISFINHIHFREVTAQDQGIELYQMLYQALDIESQVKGLDDEISELHDYISLREDRETNDTMYVLTWIATIGVPLSVVIGVFGMNSLDYLKPDTSGEQCAAIGQDCWSSLIAAWFCYWWPALLLALSITAIVYKLIKWKLRNNKKRLG